MNQRKFIQLVNMMVGRRFIIYISYDIIFCKFNFFYSINNFVYYFFSQNIQNNITYFLIIFLSISLLISIQFVTLYTKTEVDLNDDELYIFDEELNKQFKEVLDDFIVRLLYYIFSFICVCLAYIGCIVLLIFNIKDKNERK